MKFPSITATRLEYVPLPCYRRPTPVFIPLFLLPLNYELPTEAELEDDETKRKERKGKERIQRNSRRKRADGSNDSDVSESISFACYFAPYRGRKRRVLARRRAVSFPASRVDAFSSGFLIRHAILFPFCSGSQRSPEISFGFVEKGRKI